MSKKLIAVAAAAALAITGLVGIAPANASAPTITLSTVAGVTGGQNGATSATANTVQVPFENKLVASSTPATADTARKVTVANVVAGDTITVTTAGGVKVLEDLTGYAAASVNFNVANVGATSWTKTFTADPGSNEVDLYFFTTSTSTGTAAITASRTGTTVGKTFYFKGIAGEAHSVVGLAGVPTSLAKDATATASFTITDVFGNAVEGEDVTSTWTASPAHATIAAATGTTDGWDATAKNYKMTITGVKADPFVLSYDLGFTAALAGLKDTVDTFSTVVNFAGAGEQVAALQAQLAASRPKANSVTKKRWNNLVLRHRALGGTAKLKR